jgi:hypothetical protein
MRGFAHRTLGHMAAARTALIPHKPDSGERLVELKNGLEQLELLRDLRGVAVYQKWQMIGDLSSI